MLNKEEFKKINEDLAKFEDEREDEIAKSREIIRLSKIIINSLHRNDISNADSNVKEMNSKIKKLSTKNYDMSISNVAFQ